MVDPGGKFMRRGIDSARLSPVLIWDNPAIDPHKLTGRKKIAEHLRHVFSQRIKRGAGDRPGLQTDRLGSS